MPKKVIKIILYFLLINNLFSQNNAIGEYQLIETSIMDTNDIKSLIGNRILTSKFFKLSGLSGTINLNISNLLNRLGSNKVENENLNLKLSNITSNSDIERYNVQIDFIGSYNNLPIMLKILCNNENKYNILVINNQNRKVLFNYEGFSNLGENNIYNNSNSTKLLDFSNNIRNLLKAEDKRNLNQILFHYSTNLKRYWNLYNPNFNKLKTQYENSWKVTSDSKNTIQKIERIDSFTYDLHNTFKYYYLKEGKYKSVYSVIRFLFDEKGKIIEVYKLK